MGINIWEDHAQKACDVLLDEVPSKENAILLASSLIISKYIKELAIPEIEHAEPYYHGFSITKQLSNELEDSEKYLQLYQNTRDRQWLDFSNQKAVHLKKWIGIAEKHNINIDDYTHKLQEIQEYISRL